jgi:enhancing lycopene biosynthesis protein 2
MKSIPSLASMTSYCVVDDHVSLSCIHVSDTIKIVGYIVIAAVALNWPGFIG